ncbi:MAG: DUF2891 family protein, partial [Planctomycetia bacterium]|nr:DUF2891 family protein [Planctomycetia bacterium]
MEPKHGTSPLDGALPGCSHEVSKPGREAQMALHGTLRELTELALISIQRPYPFYHGQVYGSAEEVSVPGELTPVFNGAFDWHSAVHGHWTLVRALRVDPDRSQLGEAHAREIEEYLEGALNPTDLAREVEYARS